jgi:hypothetical protein
VLELLQSTSLSNSALTLLLPSGLQPVVLPAFDSAGTASAAAAVAAGAGAAGDGTARGRPGTGQKGVAGKAGAGETYVKMLPEQNVMQSFTVTL